MLFLIAHKDSVMHHKQVSWLLEKSCIICATRLLQPSQHKLSAMSGPPCLHNEYRTVRNC
jgi:hypothetical protein